MIAKVVLVGQTFRSISSQAGLQLSEYFFYIWYHKWIWPHIVKTELIMLIQNNLKIKYNCIINVIANCCCFLARSVICKILSNTFYLPKKNKFYHLHWSFNIVWKMKNKIKYLIYSIGLYQRYQDPVILFSTKHFVPRNIS